MLLFAAIKVNAQTNKPTWTVDPTLFTYDGEITGEVFIDTVAVAGGEGILGAFVGDECRGVKAGGLNCPPDSYLFIMRCYSNLPAGETITFKYYDPVTDKIYPIDEVYSFESNMIIGDAEFPVFLHVNTYVRVSRKLSSGWSWFSLNVENTDMSVPTVLGSLHATDGDYIKNQTVSATYYNGAGWFGELNNMDTKEMYKIKLGNADTLTFTGHPVDSGNYSMNINNGWNWIGYLPLRAKSVTEALFSISPVAHDYIKNQIKSSAFYNSLGWFGEMNNLEPLDGYMLKTSHTGTLTYEGTSGSFTDPRDNNKYPWKAIGTQVWMTKNLAWLPAVSPSSVGSENDPYNYVYGYEGSNVGEAKGTDNYGTYGALYNWTAAMKACPAGWHLPSDAEWATLTDYLGDNAGGKMKEIGTVHWADPNTGATNESGLNVLPGGYRVNGGGFYDQGVNTTFWSASLSGTTQASCFGLRFDTGNVGRYTNDYSVTFSVRCLRGTVLPLVTTIDLSAITVTSAISGGNILSDGGATVSVRGVCWSTSPEPTIADNKTEDGTGTVSFTNKLTSLAGGTTYYMRAYATNSAGTGYGEQKIFTTSSAFDGTFDYDGRTYKYKKIGTQTWMVENLAWLPTVSHSSDGSETKPYYYVYGYEGSNVDDAKTTANYDTYGVLYNWFAALTACPAGWHLPVEAEWSILTDYLGSGAGGLMKEGGAAHWLGPNSGATNGSGFNALPSGVRDNPGFDNLGYYSYFWSGSENGAGFAWQWYLRYDTEGLYQVSSNRSTGFSVRCVRTPPPPTVSTADVSSITVTTAISGGNITNDGGEPVTTRGVCWSIYENPTIDSAKTTDGGGSGEYVSNLTSLAGGTTYYVRAYATNNVGTAYGEQKVLSTSSAFDGTFYYDGRTYKYKAFGTQTWMVENLAYLPAVSPSTTFSDNDPYYFVKEYEGGSVGDAKATANYGTYGALYNWAAALTACPAGWHLPTDEEWKVLEMNLGMSQEEANTNYWRNKENIGGKLKEAGTTHWWDPNSGASNSSGFTALPGGITSSGVPQPVGSCVCFWSSSGVGQYAWTRSITNNNDGVFRYIYFRSDGQSVRCVKDTCSIGLTSPIAGNHEAILTQIEWKWESVPGALGYKWNTMNNPVTAINMEIGTRKTETGLLCNQTYQRYVWAYNSCGNSPATVLTQATSPDPPPTPFAGAHDASPTQIVWHWNSISELGYKWSKTNDFATAIEMGLEPYKTETGLTCDSIYTRYVWSYNPCRNSEATVLTQATLPCSVPEVYTIDITNIRQTEAISGGVVIEASGMPISAKGVCWGTNTNPTISDNFTTDGSGTESFVSNLSGLVKNTPYFVRAYATNSMGTGYGNEVIFTTLGDTAGTYTDPRDNKAYKWIKIGTQIWMAKNLAYLPAVSPSADGSENDPFYYVYDYEGNNVSIAKATLGYSTYGVLYNWMAAQTACPNGWHLPSDDEWKVFVKYLGQLDADVVGWGSSGFVGKNIKSTYGWNNSGNGDDISGFTVLPGGLRFYNGGFGFVGSSAYFWSSTEFSASSTTYAWFRLMMASVDDVYRHNWELSFGHSVRCIKN